MAATVLRCPIPDPLAVQVTEDDIRHGIRQDCTACPVARALLRAVEAALPKRWATAHVHTDAHVDIPGGGAWVAGLPYLPEDVLDWIDAFDAGRPVGPVAFALTGWRRDSEEGSDGDD